MVRVRHFLQISSSILNRIIKQLKSLWKKYFGLEVSIRTSTEKYLREISNLILLPIQFFNPLLVPDMDEAWELTGIKVVQPVSFEEQMQNYSEKYDILPMEN